MGVHPGNSILFAPSLTLKGDLSAQARQLTETIARFMEICGSFQVRFARSPKNGDLFVLRVIQGLNRFSSFVSLVSLLNNFPLVEVNASLALGNNFDKVKQRFKLDASLKADDMNLSVARIPIFPEEFQDIDIMDSTMRSTGAAVLVGSRPAVVLTKASNFMLQFGSPRISSEKKDDPGSDLFLTTADKLPMLIFPPDQKELDIKKTLFDRVNPALSLDLKNVASLCGRLRSISGNTIEESLLREAKVEGLTDEVISSLTGLETRLIRQIRDQQEIKPHLEPMGGGFSDSERKASYISYEACRAGSPKKPNGTTGNKKSILFLGQGPYKIGWGPEVDQSLIQTARAFKNQGERIVLLDNNPDTTYRDVDLFDDVCIEPPYLEVIESMIDQWSVGGVVHQFCLQVPLGLDHLLQNCGVSVLGTPLNLLANLRNKPKLFGQLREIGVSLLRNSLASDPDQAISEAERIGYPVLVHLTDRHLNPESGIMYEESMLREFVALYKDRLNATCPLFLEFYQDGNISAEFLALGDGEKAFQVAFLEHIEEHGIHSGDCATIYPALSVGGLIESLVKSEVDRIVRHFNIIGHLQVELAIRNRNVYITSVWPYPSRNLPFVQLAIDQPIHTWAGQLLLGHKISELPDAPLVRSNRFFVKESVFPFSRFPGLDPTLSTRMHSTGQVIGIEDSFGRAYFKSQLSENPKMPSVGKVFVSTRDSEKETILEVSKRLLNLGFSLVSTEGTARFLSDRGVKVDFIHKISGGRPNIIDLIINGEIALVVNIPGGFRSKVDEQAIHRAVIEHNLPLITTASGAYLMVRGMEEIRNKPITLFPLGD